MPTPDWRSPEAYRPIQTITTPGFAWEFLRRSAEYQADARRYLTAGQVTMRADAGFGQRWGLPFRSGPPALGYRDPRVLATDGDAFHDRVGASAA